MKLYELDARICPQNAKIYYNIGKISADHGDQAKAIDNYRKSIELYENYTNALNNLANILKEDPNGLIEAYNLLHRACQLDPTFATGWMNLATVELALGNFDKSERYFYRALDIRPDHANTHFNMGNLVRIIIIIIMILVFNFFQSTLNRENFEKLKILYVVPLN